MNVRPMADRTHAQHKMHSDCRQGFVRGIKKCDACVRSEHAQCCQLNDYQSLGFKANMYVRHCTCVCMIQTTICYQHGLQILLFCKVMRKKIAFTFVISFDEKQKQIRNDWLTSELHAFPPKLRPI